MMGLLDSLRKAFARPMAAITPATPSTAAARAPEEIRVPEVTAAELMAELRNGNGHKPFLLDCREHFERRQGHIPDNLHIPMNTIPARLVELDRTAGIVVYCAHGNRSYSVAGWLNQQGFTVRSLRGGIAEWQLRGGEVERGN